MPQASYSRTQNGVGTDNNNTQISLNAVKANQQELKAQNVLDKVETKFPFVRNYGDTTFDVDENTKIKLAQCDQAGLKKQMNVLKDARNYL